MYCYMLLLICKFRRHPKQVVNVHSCSLAQLSRVRWLAGSEGCTWERTLHPVAGKIRVLPTCFLLRLEAIAQ